GVGRGEKGPCRCQPSFAGDGHFRAPRPARNNLNYTGKRAVASRSEGLVLICPDQRISVVSRDCCQPWETPVFQGFAGAPIFRRCSGNPSAFWGVTSTWQHCRDTTGSWRKNCSSQHCRLRKKSHRSVTTATLPRTRGGREQPQEAC